MSGNQSQKMITQDDVAHRAGVSRSIVSYVINNGPRKVSDETRNRVLAAIKELGYRPNKHAQMLSSMGEGVAEKYIGIILAGNYMFKRPYYGSILASMHECAHESDWHIRFIRVFEDFNNPALFNELIHPNEIYGVILLGLDNALKTPEDYALIEQIVQRVEHAVCVEWEWPGLPAILFDRHHAAYQATQHLLAAGRTQIAYIGPQDKRVSGYQQALWEKGIIPDERLLYYANDPILGYESCEQLLHSGLKIDAICSGTDEGAVGILHCLHQHNLPVPQAVAVASIDNVDIAAFTIPPLTTIDIPKREIGLLTIETLVSNNFLKSSPAVSITVKTRLIVRESSLVR
ncbi:MAG TPA: LacI family DNA-binding transcriptional regulator [Phototrophicaceae bacterium]|nr:LacI family DNA-binding transcriptional regulator [Phototrophicaceae bacterium]